MVKDTSMPKGYKQTEVGVIPEDWEVKLFGEVLSRINAKEYQVQTSDYQEAGRYPVIDQGKDLVVGYSDREDKCFQRPEGGVIVFGDHTCIIKFVDFNFVVGADGTQILVAKPGQCTCFYAFQLEHHGIPTTGYNRHFKFLKERTFFSPNYDEQTTIAMVLSDTDRLIVALEKLIVKKRNIKQGAMQELLTGNKRLPGCSGKWKTTDLGRVAEFMRGRGLSKADLIDDASYKCIHYGQLFTAYKELITEVKSKTNSNEGCFYSRKNDVLMPTSDVTPNGLATASCIKEDGVILGGGILIIRLHKDYDGLYLSYYVTQNKNSILKLVKGSTVFHLYANDLAKLEVCFPDFKEQVAIAQVFTDMDTEIEQLEQKLAKYKMIKQGMMQELLTGKTRLI